MNAATVEDNGNRRRHIRPYFTSKGKSFAMVTSDNKECRRICFFFFSDELAHHMVRIPNMTHFVQLLVSFCNCIRQMAFYLISIIPFFSDINAIWRMIRCGHDNIEDFFPSMLIHVSGNGFKHILIGYAPRIAFIAWHFRRIMEFIKTLRQGEVLHILPCTKAAVPEYSFIA